MPAQRPRIGVPADCKPIGTDPSHVVGEKYLAAVAHAAKGVPLILPARAPGAELADLREMISAADLLADMDGLFLTGSASNMAPWRYHSRDAQRGAADAQRDDNTLALIGAALARDMPILAVCRGFQELNVACGGTLHGAVHEVPGLADHRDAPDAPRETRYADVHDLDLAADGWLAGWAEATTIRVNSLHGQGIDRLGEPLIAEAHAPDGLVEAARHAHATFVFGVQWHPEWRYAAHPVSMAMFAAFGDAAARFRAARRRD
ncbi:gamma-glutamyl-gamma-aminobutyrate hydrolase family protein [Salinisphaera sp. Q1T1-3]|uniref:gamma-glutamyl-gamma-aminobutyrate hydrolase family protein n=1 Tax=Salinisphaera sp. Q1T1-3 TaxID=2321229 RepID=UPI000E745A81|nr:gamma-glutamyl-gamma-aminobutyrate hydrolase family protein [Salinisphaera sp. Q1T1-3]RJS91969.1 gamma-glutamyl-gamma-aminobutyrate hydrolase family protein [Salinisphaera sp. Q1T1-3]